MDIPSGLPTRAAIAEQTARILLEIKAVSFNAREPFTWTSGRKAPTYVDCRKVISFPRARTALLDFAAATVLREIGYESLDAIAGGETADGEEAEVSVRRAVITVGGAPVEPEDDDDDAIKPLPDRLIAELTAHRTLALRNALADNPAVAFAAVLHNFVLATFYRFTTSNGCLEIAIRSPTLPPQAPGLNDSASAKAIDARHDAWKVRLPKEEGDLWDTLLAFDAAEQSSLFAHCASFGVNALYEPANRYNLGRVSAHGVRRRLDQADVLAQAVGLDMVVAGWKPTVDNYLGRVTKPRILDAVRQAKGEQSVQLIDHLKKGDMAREAERLLDGTGWLPEPLRLMEVGAVEQESDGAAEALPEFLADDDEAAADADDEQPHIIAAE